MKGLCRVTRPVWERTHPGRVPRPVWERTHPGRVPRPVWERTHPCRVPRPVWERTHPCRVTRPVWERTHPCTVPRPVWERTHPCRLPRPVWERTALIYWFTALYLCATVHGLSDPCKPGFTRIGRWCFSIHTDPATRNDSVAICERLGGGMVVLDSAEKERALTSYIIENDLLTMTDQRLELFKDLDVIINGDDETEKFCKDFLQYGTKSKKYRHFTNNKIPVGSLPEDRANLTTPAGFKIALSSIPGAGMGAWTEIPLSKYTVLGSYEGLVRNDLNDKDPYSWVVDKLGANGSYVIDAMPLDCSNWLRYVNAPRNFQEENAQPVLCAGLVFYMTIKDVPPGTELMVWYGDNYGLHLNVSRVHPEHDLNATVVFRINVVHIKDSLGEVLAYDDGSPLTYENWLENITYTVVEKSFGLLLSYDLHKERWRWLPERNFNYFTEKEGLYLPFICEDWDSELPES